MFLRKLVFALALASPVCAQQVFIIPGNDYLGLQNALQQAQPGDILIVRAGSYWAPTISIGVTILCDAGVSIGNAFGNAMIVENLPAGQRLVVRGAQFLVGHALAALTIRNCAGAVVFEDATNTRELHVSNCAHVAFNRGSLSGVQIGSSTVVVSSATVIGYTFQPALRISGGDVTVNSSDVSGSFQPPLFETSAIELQAGVLSLTGDRSVVRTAAILEPAIRTQGGTIRIDPGVQLQSAVGPITGPALVIRTPIPAAQGDGVGPGQVFHGSTYAPAGDVVYTFASWIVPPTATAFGTLWIDLQSPVLDAGLVPASGLRSYASAVPPLPFPGAAVVLQPISLSPVLEFRVGAPTTVVLD